jgi:PAS domain S-box-containing protein
MIAAAASVGGVARWDIERYATMGLVATRAVIETDTEGVIHRWDPGAESLFGYAADEALDRPVDLIVPEHLRAAHWAGFHRAMREPIVKNLTADLPVLCADGEVRTFAGRLLVLSDGLGTAIGALAIFTDGGSTGNRPFG